MVSAREAEESTSSGPAGLQVLATAAWAGAAALVLDFLLFLVTARDPASAWRQQYLPIAALSAALLVLALALAIALLTRPLWRGGRQSLGPGPTPAVLAGLLCAQAELALARFDSASNALASAWPSALFGCAVGTSVALILARARPAQRGRPRALLAAAVLLGLVAACVLLDLQRRRPSGPRTASAGHDVPRVILIVADTLRADALSAPEGGASAHGSLTPVLDAFAADAWRFPSARSAGPWTLPSMATLLTGTSPLVHGALHRTSVLPDGVPTLAESFAAAGYRTAAIGHNPVLSPSRRLNRGFDEYELPDPNGVFGRSLGYALWRRTIERRAERYGRADELVERASSWVEEHAAEDFFLWLHFYDPHLAYAPPAAFRPAGQPPAGFGRTIGFGELDRLRGGYLVPDAEGRRWVRELYDAEVRFLDTSLGAFFERLRELGLYEDSLIVFTSDHGEEFWEHQGFEHGHTSYEELLRVPLLIKLPGERPGGSDARAVSQESVAPSLLALCGLASGSGAMGAPSLFGPGGELAAAGTHDVLSAGALYFEDRLALWFDGWKYIRYLVSGREELYDLAQDPHEQRALQGSEEERLAEARKRLEAHVQSAEELRAALGVQHSAGGLTEEEVDAMRRIGYAQ